MLRISQTDEELRVGNVELWNDYFEDSVHLIIACFQTICYLFCWKLKIKKCSRDKSVHAFAIPKITLTSNTIHLEVFAVMLRHESETSTGFWDSGTRWRTGMGMGTVKGKRDKGRSPVQLIPTSAQESSRQTRLDLAYWQRLESFLESFGMKTQPPLTLRLAHSFIPIPSALLYFPSISVHRYSIVGVYLLALYK